MGENGLLLLWVMLVYLFTVCDTRSRWSRSDCALTGNVDKSWQPRLGGWWGTGRRNSWLGACCRPNQYRSDRLHLLCLPRAVVGWCREVLGVFDALRLSELSWIDLP